MAPLKKHIRQYARDMRSNPTHAEKQMWDLLREFSRDGFKFRRQVPFDNYILDFACHSARVIIEVDGHTHTSDDEVTYDKRRQHFLESRGYTVMRFWNDDVLNSPTFVYSEIEEFLKPSDSHISEREEGATR